MTLTACPSVDTLLAFSAGALDEPAAAAIEVHIDGCGACRTALSSAVRGTEPEVGFGRYRILTVLGAGGMGLVYRAHDPELARAVAIKVVRGGGDDPAERARLVREAQSLARLSHPHVCHVYDVGRDASDVWVAMELIDGVDLRQWATGRDLAEIQDALRAAARGLAAAHAAGLVHRDVKPQNLLVARDGRTVVTDFGLARADDGAATTRSGPGVVSGTPAYLAPEQLTGAPVDARVDQFAWAVTAWELVTGARPFPVEPAARLAAIRAGVTAPRDVPARLGAALVRALAAAPRDRFASMDELIAAIGDADPTPAPRSRHRTVVVATALVAVVAIAVAAAPWPRGRGADRAAAAADPPLGPVAAHAGDAAAPADPPPGPPMAVASTDGGAALGVRATVAPAVRAPTVDAGALARTDAAAAVLAVTAVIEVDAGVAVDAAPAAAPPASFDRARAERMLADCRFPVDPGKPDPALDGAVIDWGRVTRRERVLGSGSDGEHAMSMFEVKGARATYRLDGDGIPKLGSLAADLGDLIVICPFQIPATALVDRREMPPGWRAPSPPVYAFAPTRVVPRIASDLVTLAPLHVTEAVVRTAPPERPLLVWARPRARAGALVDMGGWSLDASGPDLDALALGRPGWFVVDWPQLAQVDGRRHVTMRAVVALRRLLD